MSDEERPTMPKEVADALASLRDAFLADSDRRSAEWAAERAEAEARHRAEVARVQKNSDETRALHRRSIEASERLAAAMERIAAALETR